ncbi:MAG: PAS domain S-box protein, partial [Lentisphaeria bacterium]|nr:PAS domain S-box protein [Lentisphaeria bacterium]NQZ67320.1 PAS domain S-box protein [Lentisphaeria bacterium]
WGGSLLCILFSSLGIVLFAHSLINRRVRVTLDMLKQVETGTIGARIEVGVADEIGQLQEGINSMVSTIGSLLTGHRRNEEELAAILSAIEDGVIAVSADGQILHCNTTAATFLGTQCNIETGTLADCLPVLAERDIPPWQDPLADGNSVHGIMFDLQNADGEWRLMELDCTPITTNDGLVEGAVVVLRDVTEEHALQHNYIIPRRWKPLGNWQEVWRTISIIPSAVSWAPPNYWNPMLPRKKKQWFFNR